MGADVLMDADALFRVSVAIFFTCDFSKLVRLSIFVGRLKSNNLLPFTDASVLGRLIAQC